MNDFSQFIGENMYFKMNGENRFVGRLIDAGNDVLVIYNGVDFVYISLYHIQYYRLLEEDEESDIKKPEVEPSIQDDLSSISLRKILTAAKGIFTEIYVTGKHPVHGFVTNVMTDYFVFYSPLYKTIYVSLKHLKWIIPYNPTESPYGLSRQEFPVSEINQTLARTLEEQLKKSAGKMVIFNFGDQGDRVGKLMKIDNSQIEIKKARRGNAYLNMNHVQTIHFP
ncbi:hypothetical protein SAMN05877753_11040 [Bacillus oleivorans]|uniref:DUF2642 domain-containing protein n=1 Tax=Bacillus oleivorans TaxID=1448271 RepID=A0A285D4J1_9BACI|nr:DUF2642 domain-containing protein [Bacillus oleivorans]SNX74722.1 hypothetical protein SAMN05877753_11040 [Bacillus oleivorans]